MPGFVRLSLKFRSVFSKCVSQKVLKKISLFGYFTKIPPKKYMSAMNFAVSNIDIKNVGYGLQCIAIVFSRHSKSDGVAISSLSVEAKGCKLPV